MHTTFTLMIENAEGTSQTVVMEADLPTAGPHFLDETEQALLRVFHSLQLETYRRQAEHMARQLAETAQVQYGGTLIRSSHPYRIDGEMGRISLDTYVLQNEKRVVWTPEADGFPTLGSRQQHVTAHFRELVLTLTDLMSFRNAAHLVRRVRQGGLDARTPVTTLAERVEREGAAVQTWIDQKTVTTLAQHHFTPEGVPTPDTTVQPLADDQGRLPQSVIDAAMAEYNAGKSDDQQIPVQAAHDFYEDPDRVINISIDDVSVKKQKVHRNSPVASAAKAAEPSESFQAETGSATEAPPPGKKDDPPVPKAPKEAEALKRVHHTIAHIQSTAGHDILRGRDTETVLRILLAFLLVQDVLTTCRIQFFADGARALHKAIQQGFDWVPSLRTRLDWYHLEKKCGEYWSMALAGREIRKEVLHTLTGYLWLGRVDDAISYLQHLSADRIKRKKWLHQTIDYLERHREEIPCDALRQALGLRNSSNRGEKANDRCVADRQKHKGMSRSADRSTRLTSTTTLLRNHELALWCTAGELGWQWVA